MTGLSEEIGKCHDAYLRHTQTIVNPVFASHALPVDYTPCNIVRMRVQLSDIRESKNLNLEDIATELDVAISTVQRWEKQTMSIPSERLPAIAKAYGCRIYQIFDDGEGAIVSEVQPAVESARVPVDSDTMAQLLDVILPLAPPDPVPEQSLRALSSTLAYGLELLGCSLATPATQDALTVAVRGVKVRSRELGLQ